MLGAADTLSDAISGTIIRKDDAEDKRVGILPCTPCANG